MVRRNLHKLKDDFFDISENLTNNSKKYKEIIKEDDKFLEQFEPLTFSSKQNPDSFDSDDELTENDQTNYTFGIVDDENFIHNNMIPQFKSKNGYGSNDNMNFYEMDYKNQLFTGNFDYGHKNKKEVNNLFSPNVGKENIYGTPNITDIARDRCPVSNYKNGTLPFNQKQVTPGLGLDYNENGTQGFHDQHRIMPKSIDYLRINPKTVNAGRIIPGMRGEKRKWIGKVFNRRKPVYKSNTKDDLIPNSYVTQGPKVKDNIIMHDTNRADQNIEYTGGAFNREHVVDGNIPEELREKYKESTRQNFKNPEPMNKYGINKFNSNSGSYNIQTTNRDISSTNGEIFNIGVNTGTYTNNDQEIRTTLRDTLKNPEPNNFVSNTMRGMTHNFDITKPTLRELTEENSIGPIIQNNSKSRVYNNDDIKLTMRETLSEPESFNFTGNSKLYANIQDEVRTTGREIIENNGYFNIETDNMGNYINLQDDIKKTSRETLNNNYNATNMYNTPTTYTNLNDIMRITGRETLKNQNNPNINLSSYGHTTNLMDSANTTGRETLRNQNNFNINMQNHGHRTNLMDTPLTTMREILIENNEPKFINGLQNGPNVNLQDVIRTTTRETLSNNKNHIVAPYKKGYYVDNNINMDPTLRDLITSIPQNLFVNSGQNGPQVYGNDEIKTTLRETLKSNPVGNFTGNNRGNVKMDNELIATNRDTYIDKNIILGPEQAGYKNKMNSGDIAKATLRDTENKHMGVVTGDTWMPKTMLQDIMKTTNRETLSTNTHKNILTGNKKNTVPLQDIARTTIRETTIKDTLPHTLATANVSGNTANTLDRNEQKTTLREMIVENKYVNPSEGINKYTPQKAQREYKTKTQRENHQQYHKPTPVNVFMGPNPGQINMQVRNDNNVNRYINGPSETNNLRRTNINMRLSEYPMVDGNRFMDPVLLKQLEQNPYNISII